METKITTKDGKQVTIQHSHPITDDELKAMRKMPLRELYNVGSISGIIFED